MRTAFRFLGAGLVILFAMPALAQVESTQQMTGAPGAAPAISQEQQFPSVQDTRSPLTTIMNRQRPGTATGAQPGAAAGAGPTPGARTVFPGGDLQQRI